MGITDKFEERAILTEIFVDKRLGVLFVGEDVYPLLTHARALESQNESLRAMLKKHEWGWNGEAMQCLEGCQATTRPFDHAPDCELAKLLVDGEASD